VRWLLYTNLFIATAAAVLSAGSFRLLGQEPDPWFCVWVFMATLCVYTVQRLMKLRTYSLSTEMMAWVAAHRRGLSLVAVVSLLASFLMALKLPFELLLNAWPMALISLLYAFPFLPRHGQRIALREWPYAKLFLIAGVWTFITIWMPMRLSAIDIGTWEIAMLLERFAFIMAITIPFDIRDEGLDSPGMRTLPQVMGRKGATVLAICLLLLSWGILLLGMKEDHISSGSMFWTSTVYTLSLILIYIGRSPRANWFYLGLLDGQMILLGVIWMLS
jgi:hypothetical protein